MIKRILLGLILVIVIFAVNFLWSALPLISAYGSKMMCSCVFLSNRTPESVINDELSVGWFTLGKFSVDREEQSASGTVFGVARRKAIYRNGLGCTLVNGITEEELRNQSFNLLSPPEVDLDTIPWPSGNLMSDSLIQKYPLDELAEVIDAAFTADQYIHPAGTRAVVVVKDNLLVGEQYAEGFDLHTPQLGWSMTKSLMNTAIGILSYTYDFPDIEDPVPYERWQDTEKETITTNQLLQMSSGLSWTEHYAGPGDATDMLFFKYSAAAVASSVGMEAEPGAHWEYSSGTSNILSQVVREFTGDELYHVLWQKELFYKIGMHHALIEPDPSQSYVGSSFGWALPREWARFGLLYLNDGVWQSERLLPKGWAKYSASLAEHSHGQYGAQ
jgi:hypothetical protein